MVRFGQLSVTLSNACEVQNVCRRYCTLSMGIQVDWGLHELLKATSLRSLTTNGSMDICL
jgi:hypothetical protein